MAVVATCPRSRNAPALTLDRSRPVAPRRDACARGLLDAPPAAFPAHVRSPLAPRRGVDRRARGAAMLRGRGGCRASGSDRGGACCVAVMFAGCRLINRGCSRSEGIPMAENIAVVVDWYGPYERENFPDTLKAACQVASEEWGRGLYAVVGNKTGQRRGPRHLLYVGVGDPLHRRLTPRHHAIGKIDNGQIWLGHANVPGIPGRRRKKIHPHLDSAEWAHVYFLQTLFNEKKTMRPPDISCVVINRWWGTDFETPHDRPAARWADIIEFDEFRNTANLVWFGAKARVKAVPL